MRRYEVMIIFSGKLQDDNLKTVVSKTEEKLMLNGTKLVKKDEWGLKDFAYEIKKEKKGYYNIYYVEADSETIEEINRFYRITSGILRIMVIKHEDKWPYELNQNVVNKLPVRPQRKNYNKKKYTKRTDDDSKSDSRKPANQDNKEVVAEKKEKTTEDK